jgi:hypothetical protein
VPHDLVPRAPLLRTLDLQDRTANQQTGVLTGH